MVNLTKIALTALLTAGVCLAYPKERTGEYQTEMVEGRQAGILGGLGMALAPVLGAIIGPILSNLASSITNGLTNLAGIARPNNVELYMMRVPGAPGPYLFVTTRGRRQRPLAITQALSRPLESEDNQVEEAAPQSVVYERDQEDAVKKPAYFSQNGAYPEEPSDLNDDYLDQYFYNGPQYYSQQTKPALTKIFPSDKSDSNRQISNSRSTLKL